MKRLILAALMVAAFAVPSFASVQNVKVSGDIDSTYLYRSNFDLGTAVPGLPVPSASISDLTQSVFLTQTRLRVDADLTDNVSTTVALINERAWNTNTSASSDIDLNLAYVTLREMLYSPLTVVVGRQAFHFGNSFIFDTAGTNNAALADSGISGIASDLIKQRAQDSIRAILDYKPLTLQLFYSTVANTATAQKDSALNRDDINTFGANATYELGDKMNTQVEGYFFAKRDRTTATIIGLGASGNAKADTIYLPGVRVSTKPIEGLNVQGELAWQTGTKVVSSATNLGAIHRDAMAVQFIANYEIPALKEYKPMAQYVYTYTSGDHNPANVAGSTQTSREYYRAWDPFFENQGGGSIYNTIFNLTNSHIHAVSLSATPIEDVTTKVTWTGLWLANDSTNPPYTTLALVQPGSAAVTPQVQNGKSQLGNEIDWQTDYAYTEDVTIGANLGWYLPGDFFKTINEKIASQAIIHMNVNF